MEDVNLVLVGAAGEGIQYRFPEGKGYWTVERNATGQLARLLRSEYRVEFQGRVSRYDGLPLTAEAIRSQFHG